VGGGSTGDVDLAVPAPVHDGRHFGLEPDSVDRNQSVKPRGGPDEGVCSVLGVFPAFLGAAPRVGYFLYF